MDPYSSAAFGRIQLFLNDLTLVLGSLPQAPLFGPLDTTQPFFNHVSLPNGFSQGFHRNQRLGRRPTHRSRVWKKNQLQRRTCQASYPPVQQQLAPVHSTRQLDFGGSRTVPTYATPLRSQTVPQSHHLTNPVSQGIFPLERTNPYEKELHFCNSGQQEVFEETREFVGAGYYSNYAGDLIGGDGNNQDRGEAESDLEIEVGTSNQMFFGFPPVSAPSVEHVEDYQPVVDTDQIPNTNHSTDQYQESQLESFRPDDDLEESEWDDRSIFDINADPEYFQLQQFHHQPDQRDPNPADNNAESSLYDQLPSDADADRCSEIEDGPADQFKITEHEIDRHEQEIFDHTVSTINAEGQEHTNVCEDPEDYNHDSDHNIELHDYNSDPGDSSNEQDDYEVFNDGYDDGYDDGGDDNYQEEDFYGYDEDLY